MGLAARRIPSLEEVRTELAERRLADFVKQAWPILEPARPLVWGWHNDAVCEHLEAVTLGKIRNLVISIPFRCSKSLTVSVLWPSWAWIRFPEFRWLYSSYAATLSVRDSVRCRRVLDSPWYQARWGDRFRLVSDQNQKIRFDNDRTGYRLATSVGGANTGEGGDAIVVDDALNANETLSDASLDAVLMWWDEVMSSRLDDPRSGRRVIVGQRLHSRDLTGHVLKKEHGAWEHLCLPMEYDARRHCHTSIGFEDPRVLDGELLCPDRFPANEVERLKGDLGDYGAASQMQQDPTPRGGLMFKREWIRKVPALPAGGDLARGWDFAGTKPTPANRDPDWTVGLLLAHVDGRFYIVIPKLVRLREEPADVERALVSTASADGFSVSIGLYQDPAQAGKYQIQQFVGLLAGYTVEVLPAVNLFELVAPIRAQAQVGNLLVVDPEMDRGGSREAEQAIDEICGFPNAVHDDVLAGLGAAFHVHTRTPAPPDYDTLNS